MNLRTYLIALPLLERDALAKRCGTTANQLRNIAYGRSCSESLAIALERETHGVVTCEILRPDVDWAYLRGTAPKEKVS